MPGLNGKVAVVTGAASGIGAAVARRFAAGGASVCVSDLQADPARALADELTRSGARAIAVTADVTEERAVAEIVDRAVAELGPLDVMVNNAGIGERPVPIDERSADEWTRVIATNLNSVFFGIKHAARVMKAAGRAGVILNMSSILGSVAFSGAPAYTAAKHGVDGLTKAAALELAAAKIRVVAIAPAFIRTPLIAGMEDAVLPLHPIGRLGEPDEVANLCAFLASDEASFITGVSYLIDGGYTAQ
ncbi:MAG TPA: SDR family NAD(P)-dependent oxidoreductase [Thermoanaerobaculia bacterium]|nr:SDR family NAD(P)-dependent oxidoreductase [Thermoanaerobaculia bacterium]